MGTSSRPSDHRSAEEVGRSSRFWRFGKVSTLLSALVVGWGFILWANKFHVTASVVIICLGHLAAVAAIFNLWRTGVAAAISDAAAEQAWDRPIGPVAALEKEKRTLLKAIREAEFDFAMRKLSKADSDALIQMYRARAIDVMKELDRQRAGAALSPSEQIAREVKARIALAGRTKTPIANRADATSAHPQYAAGDVEGHDSTRSESIATTKQGGR